MARRLPLLLLLLALILPGPAPAAAGRTVRVGVYDFEPLVTTAPGNPPEGLFIDVIEEIAREEGWALDYVPGSWTECLQRLKTGDIDLLASVGYSEERARLFAFPRTYLYVDSTVIYKNRDSSIETVLDLEGKTLAALEGGLVIDRLRAFSEPFHVNYRILEKPTYPEVFAAVARGEADGVVITSLFAKSHQLHRTLEPTAIIFAPVRLTFAAPASGRQPLLDAIDRHLTQLKQDPDSIYHRSIERWLTPPTPALPSWAVWTLAGSAAGLLWLLGFSLLLKNRVGTATARLQNSLEELQRSEEQLRFVLEGSQLGFWDWDIAANEVRRNARWAEMLGYSYSDIADDILQWQNLVHPEDRDAAWDSIQRHLAGESAEHLMEYRMLHRQGQIVWILDHAKVVQYGPAGEPLRMTGTHTDITALKRAEEALLESERRWRSFLETIHLAAIILDRQGQVLFCNAHFLRLTGWDAAQVLGENFFDRFIPEAERSLLKDRLAAGLAQDRIAPHFDQKIVTRSGTLLLMAWDNTLQRDSEGQIIAIASIGQDVTEHRRLEEQLRQSQKMEAIGQLAGGIAHDFNNVLSAILGNAELICYKLPAGNEVRGMAEHIIQAGERAAALTRSLLAYSRRQHLAIHPLDLNRSITALINMLRRIIPENIELRLELAAEPLPVVADDSLLGQALMNLVTNARDAMPAGGFLRIATRRCRLDAAQAATLDLPADREWAELQVQDSGHGIDPAIRERIFEPFFTTKAVGHGTGLGLAMVFGTIRQHNGGLDLDSAPGEGTTFRLYLPLEENRLPVQPPASPSPPPSPAGGGETLLVVEDDPDVRTSSRQILESFGFRVIEATDGDEGIRLFREHCQEVRLVILDVVMPKRGGREVYEAIRQLSPGVPVIFTSGYVFDDFDTAGLPADDFHFLPKPVSPQQMLTAIRRLLDAHPAPA